ncbi:Gfo/Idh/MocA family protein [Lacticaseibacillus parakribbianus]|uniref:Gfo/Idh/MocA family protein n=1 Tax=Lacticaseibacillus parakribbianus TaxID=2970927 RepID=UPI0021CB1AE7|nr:Gfo/Idh/MocA family oxidoreductase [Lacticaseibacillus parakribbianus]
MTIKIGIIGVGSIAQLHLAAYKQNPHVEVYALCDINEPRLIAQGKLHGVERLYTDYNEMLKLEELDAVSVCTWNAEHAPASIAALNAGKNVLCEKPMAMNPEQAVAMKAAADAAGKLLMIGFAKRHSRECQTLKDFADQGFFGDMYYAKAEYYRRNGNPGSWFSNLAYSGGGPLIDLGVHFIDLTRYLMGNPKPVSVYGATFHAIGDRPYLKDPHGYQPADSGIEKKYDVEDFATALVRFDNGAVMQVEDSYDMHLKQEGGNVQIFGTKAGATIFPKVEMFTENNGYLMDYNFAMNASSSFDELFVNEINHYIDCIETHRPSIAPPEDGIAIMKILSGIYESARTQHEVRLD